jgi:hypothetical protein
MRSARIHITLFLALLLLCACTKVHSQNELRSLVSLRFNDSIVLLSMLQDDNDYDDEDADNCIRPTMLDANPELHFMPAKQFRGSLYPYLTPNTTPHDLEGYTNLLNKPEIRKRIDFLGVGYLVIVTKGGTDTHGDGAILCGGGYPGAAGCLGLAWWDRKSELVVAVLDLKTKFHAGSVQASATGTGVMPALILPIPIYIPATKSAVCGEVGTRLGKLLSGQD